MAPLTVAQLRALLTPPATPCISLYMPAHRSEPQRREDPVRYRNLLRHAEELLRQSHPDARANVALGKFHSLADDITFWSTALDGLAVLGAGEFFRALWLTRPVPELAVVADSFHVKPLLRIVQSADRFHVLGITRTEAFLYEGDRYGLRQIMTPQFPPKYEEVVGAELTNADRTAITRGGRSPETGHYSGHGARKDELGRDAERYFRAVDKMVLEQFTKPSGWPLVLVGLEHNQGDFRRLSQNPQLVPEGIAGDPGAFTPDQLRAQAWKVMEPRYLARLARLKEDFGTAQSRGLGSKDPEEVTRAALDGQVGLLMVDADKVIPGKVDRDARTARLGNTGGPADDVLDDLAELVLRADGEVVVVPSDRMPTDTGLAALYRYPGGHGGAERRRAVNVPGELPGP